MESSEFYNLEAEAAVLGSIMLEPELIKEVFIRHDQLMPGRNSNLLWTMVDLDSKNIPIDPVSILERIGTEKSERVGGISYLAQLTGEVMSTSNFIYYQSVILEYHNKRESNKVIFQLQSGEIELDEGIKKLVLIQDNKHTEDDGDINEALIKTYNSIENATGEITGIASGFRDLDKITSGSQDGTLTILGARPSIGKTAFALNVAINSVAKPNFVDGAVVAVFSFEMSKEELLKRMAAATGNIDMQAMKRAGIEFKPEDWNKLNKSIGVLSKSDLKIFDDSMMDTNFIWSKLRKLKRKFPGRKILAIIDYIQLVVPDPSLKGNRNAEISDISVNLKRMARDLNIPIMALSQLSRGVEQRQDKRPMLSDLRESGSLEQDADIVKFLYREDYYDRETEDRNMIEVIIAKHRDGPTGTVKLAFIKEFGKMVTIDWGSYVDTKVDDSKKGWSK